MTSLLGAAAIGAAMLAGIAVARADNIGDLRQGRNIAVQECSRCHAVESGAKAANAQAPAFAAIANMDSATHLSIRVFLRSAHRNKTMPNIILSDDEVDALASYILSLRK